MSGCDPGYLPIHLLSPRSNCIKASRVRSGFTFESQPEGYPSGPVLPAMREFVADRDPVGLVLDVDPAGARIVVSTQSVQDISLFVKSSARSVSFVCSQKTRSAALAAGSLNFRTIASGAKSWFLSLWNCP